MKQKLQGVVSKEVNLDKEMHDDIADAASTNNLKLAACLTDEMAPTNDQMGILP